MMIKYKCISVDYDIILDINDNLNTLKTYFHKLKRPEFGLAYHGITIIPPESLNYFEDVLLTCKENRKTDELDKLIALVKEALKQNKHIIHYGI